VGATGDGATLTVTVPVLKDEPPLGPVATSSASTPATQATPLPTRTPAAGEWSTPRKAAIGLGAVGFAGLVLGTGFGGLAAGNAGASSKLCTPQASGAPDRCSPEGGRLREEANTFANVANAGFIGGITLGAIGAILWFTAPEARDAAPAGKSAARVAIVAGP